MSSSQLQSAYDKYRTTETAWKHRKEQREEAQNQLAQQLENGPPYDEAQLRYLREFIDVNQWEITLSAGSVLRAHDSVQRISVRKQLNTFMQQNGEALTSALAPVLMKLGHSSGEKRHEVMRDALGYIQEALLVYLVAHPEIHYVAEDSDILTAIGLYPDTSAMNDTRRFYTPAQSHTYAQRKAALEREKPALNPQ
ncbi:phage polarity suppression protein [Serratia sp. UGAL515B_01]|uniref:phage polarity suppression protein n=1 Tax=Serratia sp. UGAL515B_01 TaxID=2986763 RepID=UPI002952EEBE|nr:phage polarity suppression protein [Serratia sp. UGAL515B_01]WON77423.1 Polarity suppression protein [Serratia sp. UGAL515B_01]